MSALKLKINGINLNNENNIITNTTDIIETTMAFTDFIARWNDSGSFWIALYGKSFFDVMKDFLKELGHDILLFILGNGDIFFLAPAIIFMFITFLVGKNKYTKWILPLWFMYFLSSVFHKLII